MKRKMVFVILSICIVLAAGGLYLKGIVDGRSGKDMSLVATVEAAGGVVKDPKGAAPDRYVYYPGTEPLAEDEIRVVVGGSGMPAARRAQAATCFLIETGNGDKFLFDIGTGSMVNIAALMIPYDWLDKVFLTHLHTDHMGDIDALWAGGWTGGRTKPLRVWGPSGQTPEMGTKYSMDNFMKHANWDFQTRAFALNPKPGMIETTEFDYKGENQVVYQENGVTIRSWPAVHTGDGSVSYSLEYKGMKVVVGGDTFPNKWFIKYAKGADLAIHEAFMEPELFVKLYNMPPQLAWRACCAFHTSGQAFGKIMSLVKPRHAVAYHFFNEEATRYSLYDNIRETYDGPLSMATDMMVWNITKDKITERMAVSTEEAWSVPTDAIPPRPEPGYPNPYSKWILDGRVDDIVQPVQKKMLDNHMDKYNLQDQDWRKQMMKKK
jgi:ribonuclease Z